MQTSSSESLAPQAGTESTRARGGATADTSIDLRGGYLRLLTGIGALSIATTVLAAVQLKALSEPVFWAIALIGFVFAAIRFLLGRSPKVSRWARLMGNIIAALGFFAAILHLFFLPYPVLRVNELLMAAGFGSLLLPSKLIALVTALTVGAWIPLNWATVPDFSWLHFALGVLMASTLRFRTEIMREQLHAALNSARSELLRMADLESQLESIDGRYKALADSAQDVIFTAHPGGKFTSLNCGFEKLTGWSAEDWVDMPLTALIRPKDVPQVEELLKRLKTGDPVQPSEVFFSSKTGHFVPVELTLAAYSESGEILGLSGIARDLREEKEMQNRLEKSEERFQLAAQGANDGLWDWDIKNSMMHFSRRWKDMLGYEDDEIGTRPEEWFKKVHPEDVRQVRSSMLRHLEGEADYFESTYRLRHKDGTHRWMLARGVAMRDANGIAYRMVGSQTDITRFKMTEQQLLHDAFHDPLTGLANRALFTDRLSHAIKRFKRSRGSSFALLFLDLDRFKVVNDSLGHEAGDRLLVETARRLEHCIRGGDTVARLGGDEFTILLEDVNNVALATRVAENIQQRLKLPFNLSGQEVFTTASIGIAFSRTAYDKPVELLRDADIAMYRAKILGKARHEVFDHDMHRRAVEQLQLENDFRRAIDREEFEAYYQPIVDLKTGEIRGFEALARWQHPERGLLLPDDFLAVAEETGLIMPMSWWILRKACEQTKKWQEHFRIDPPLSISVNLSAKHFSQPDIIEQIQQALDETNLDPASLKIEITEGAIMEEGVIDNMEKLKALKVDLHLDDFGTGYSSLSYLHRFPIDASKIDRSFVASMIDDAESAQIIQTMVTLSHSLGMKVIAEGVETADQASRLRMLKCEYGQGFLYSRPIPHEAAERMLSSLFGRRSTARQFRLPAVG